MRALHSRDDQREENNLPMLHEDQNQGRMLVIDEAKAAHSHIICGKGNIMQMRIASELLFLARELLGMDFPTQDAMDKYLKEHITERLKSSGS